MLKRSYLALRAAALRKTRRAPGPRPRGAARKFLIVNLPRLGDISLSTGAIRAIGQSVRNCEIVVAAPIPLHPLLEGQPGVIGCIDHPGRKLRRAWEIARSLPDDWQPDVAIDLSLDWPAATSWLVRGVGAARTFGFDVEGRGPLFDFSVQPGAREHVIDSMRRLLTLILNEDPGQLAPAAPKRFSRRRPATRRIVVHPGATAPTQRWEPERFARAARSIASSHSADVVVLGSTRELDLIERFETTFGPDCRRVVTNDLEALARELRAADVVLCNNSGPMHLAAALGTPTVSTHGPTVIERFAPVGERHRVVSADLECLGCNQNRCPRGDYACMKQLEPERMVEAASSLLPNRAD